MASYQIVGQRPDTEIVGGTKTRDVQVIEVVTNAHGIYFETSLPRALATTANIRNNCAGFTAQYEALFDNAGVSAVQWTQEPTPAGLLEDHVIVYVVSDSGDSEGVLDFSYTNFHSDYTDPRIAKLRASLNATEAT